MHQARCKRCVAAQKYRPTFICGQVALDALHTRRHLPFPSLPHINHSPPFLHLPIQDSVLRRNRGAAFEWILGIPDQRKGCRREKSKRYLAVHFQEARASGTNFDKIKRENHDPRTWTSQVQTVIKWQAAVRCLVFRSRGAWQYATQRI